MALEYLAFTVTVDGTVATPVLLLDSVTTIPLDGAAALSFTVPCDLLPPPTLAGLSVNEESVGGNTVRAALCDALPTEALIVRLVELATDFALTVKLALMAPAATVTLAGTVAAPVLLLDRFTTRPPDGAALLSVTMPCELPPLATLAGFNASKEGVGGDTVSVAFCAVEL